MSFTFEPPSSTINQALHIEDVENIVDNFVIQFMDEEKILMLSNSSLDVIQVHIISFLSRLYTSFYTSDSYFSIPNKYRPYATIRLLEEYIKHVKQRVLFFNDNAIGDPSKYKPVDFKKELGLYFENDQLSKEMQWMEELENDDSPDPSESIPFEETEEGMNIENPYLDPVVDRDPFSDL